MKELKEKQLKDLKKLCKKYNFGSNIVSAFEAVLKMAHEYAEKIDKDQTKH